MTDDNVVSIQDDLNLAMTVQNIKDLEKLMLETRGFKSTWGYMIVDANTGRYLCAGPEGSELRHAGPQLTGDINENNVHLFTSENAKELCEKLNEQKEGNSFNALFAPILWRRYCIIHLAALYDVIQKMDAKGKTKRFFASC